MPPGAPNALLDSLTCVISTANATDLESLAINVVRGISMDAPAAANSGHQGTAMALAPLAHVLWTRIMKYDPARPDWPDRDRFVLSNGHASILQYAMLHLTGYDLSIDDLKAFRQWGSRTPGHPEAGHTTGVEVTTGPLGQGFANAVGMAIAERYLRGTFGADVMDHHTYVIMGDGCMSEGVSHEAASLAGHQKLGHLIAMYDNNHITIDGNTDLALSDDSAKRFEAYGWHVLDIGENAKDLDVLESALNDAKAETERPSLVIIRSHIGYPSPTLTDHHSAHGLAFGADEITAAKDVMGLPNEPFYIPAEVKDFYGAAGAAGAEESTKWDERLATASIDRDHWEACWGRTGVAGWDSNLPTFEAGKSVATRKSSQAVIDAIAAGIPGLIGGSADLTGNTGTKLDGLGVQSADEPDGRQIYFGVREHAMGSALVGMAHHGGVIPFAGTFEVFADYMRPSLRLAALSNAKAIFVFSHDSVGVGEDGPTHQPVEQTMSLRLIPNLTVIRPGDATESVGAWQAAIASEGPTALVFSRQNVPVQAGTNAGSVAKGAYAINEVATPDAIVIGTGSELGVATDAAELLAADGTSVRVVSMPSWELFTEQGNSYMQSILPPGIPTVSVEAGVTMGWQRWANEAIGIDRFGASAPGNVVMEKLGITPDAVAEAVRGLL
ncbi:MAG: transketolase [Acidimicrobiales bacterium]|nr:transketolase [Acidimicrobiales bacterium]